MTAKPTAVLLDVGGVFLLPSRTHIRSALDQVGHNVTEDEAIDKAHYVAVRSFPMDLEGHEFMGPYWQDYLEAYAGALEVHEALIPEAVEHLRNEYVTGGLWSHEIDGSREGLRKLAATGITVGVVSNSDGTIGDRLRELEILQVGAGPGVEVACLVDSGAVGVEKPDPKIFDYAIEALDLSPEEIWYLGDTPAFDVVGAKRAGLRPILVDPFGVNGDFGVSCVTSLADVAEMVSSA
jgi:putative hydrolase of the HAD superfamily